MGVQRQTGLEKVTYLDFFNCKYSLTKLLHFCLSWPELSNIRKEQY